MANSYRLILNRIMNVEVFRDYCLSKPHVTESFPFDEATMVFKVAGKMFALTNLNRFPFQVNLKCNPEQALMLREEYVDIILPGYHMNKTHWNTVILSGNLSEKFILALIDNSYDLVVNNMSKKKQHELGFL